MYDVAAWNKRKESIAGMISSVESDMAAIPTLASNYAPYSDIAVEKTLYDKLKKAHSILSYRLAVINDS